jgi:hypothetical protein
LHGGDGLLPARNRSKVNDSTPWVLHPGPHRPRSEMATEDDVVRHARNIDLRRAVLSVLIRRQTAMTIGEIIEDLAVEEKIVLVPRTTSESVNQRLGDLLRWQLRRGRLERVGRGRYRMLPRSLTTSTAWRCRNWRVVAERRDRR